MVKRRRLADLVDQETQKQPTDEPKTLEETGNNPQLLPPKEQEDIAEKEQSMGEMPKYLTLVRKEARLREDQFDALVVIRK